ncbi:hypothetical protein [Humibacillus xanthopallidus]|uniref:Uncharacterized protein n=1 Tax=Humibacillus xanthopallidus TaxID=412689 RepID=A0A543HZX7_9MICO|nr:hypothetical protein [Humibacillus xanthopallidus]TQM63795.1 hypothetical protein FBY41_0148 [Humibacillus xanthopallidus]
MNSPVGADKTASGLQDSRDRTKAVARWAVGVSWVWVVPLAGAAVVVAYLSLLFVGLAAEALGGQQTPWAITLALGLPALGLLLAAAVGLGIAFVAARWMSRLKALAPLRPWLIGTSAAALGGAAAISLFWAAMTGVGRVGSS